MITKNRLPEALLEASQVTKELSHFIDVSARNNCHRGARTVEIRQSLEKLSDELNLFSERFKEYSDMIERSQKIANLKLVYSRDSLNIRKVVP